jgi:hypothetical protein
MLFRFWGYQFVPLTMNIDNLDRVIGSQMLTQFCDIYIHAAGVEIVVVGPHGLQREVTLQNLVLMST